jgi:uncharacterized protein YndB with AHSA1/START domain
MNPFLSVFLTIVTAAQHSAAPVPPLVHTAVVEAPVSEVWKAWTTSEGIKSWMVAEGEVDLRIGGALRTSYTKGSDPKGPNAIVNTILAFDPERMLTIKNTQSPATFPFKKAMADAWTVIYLEPVSPSQTKVTCRMLGYTQDPESVSMRKFFDRGNQMTMDALAARFAKK